MQSITLNLPEPLEKFVAEKVSTGGFQTPQDYLLSLVSQAQLEDALMVGIDQIERGECKEMTKADWDELRAEYRRHVEQKKVK